MKKTLMSRDYLMKGKAGSAERVPEGSLAAELVRAVTRPFCPAGVIRG